MTVTYQTTFPEQQARMEAIIKPFLKDYVIVQDIVASPLIGVSGVIISPKNRESPFLGLSFLPAMLTESGEMPSKSELERAAYVEIASNQRLVLKTADNHSIFFKDMSRDSRASEPYRFSGLVKLIKADENGIRVLGELGPMQYLHSLPRKKTTEETQENIYDDSKLFSV